MIAVEGVENSGGLQVRVNGDRLAVHAVGLDALVRVEVNSVVERKGACLRVAEAKQRLVLGAGAGVHVQEEGGVLVVACDSDRLTCDALRFSTDIHLVVRVATVERRVVRDGAYGPCDGE